MKDFATNLPDYNDLLEHFKQWATPYLPGKVVNSFHLI